MSIAKAGPNARADRRPNHQRRISKQYYLSEQESDMLNQARFAGMYKSESAAIRKAIELLYLLHVMNGGGSDEVLASSTVDR